MDTNLYILMSTREKHSHIKQGQALDSWLIMFTFIAYQQAS